MKTRILLLVSSLLACSNETFPVAGCLDAPPEAGSACDPIQSEDVCTSTLDAGEVYHCTDAGTWVYVDATCPADPHDVHCADLAGYELTCTYGSCDDGGVTIASCDRTGRRTIMYPECHDGG